MIMPAAEAASGLPNFSRPPVSEVVLGMQFAAPGIGAVHVGQLYAQLGDRFPKLEQHPPLQPSFETFAPAPFQAAFHLPMFPPFARQWFISEDYERVVQFQSDRLLVNWRERIGGGAYPRYSSVRALFVEAFEALDLLLKEGAGPFSPNQCEVSYINVIPLEDTKGWAYPDKWIRLWNGERDRGESVHFQTRHLLSDETGQPYARLVTTLEGGSADGRPILQLTLAAKGRPLLQNVSGVLDFFDRGRAAIVKRFADVLTDFAKQDWGLQT